jgi:uncharacterized protein (DUF1919 family)
MSNNIFRKIVVFIRRKYRVIFKNYLNKKDISLLKDQNFVIISNNCWGGEIYQWLQRPYNTPFIGLGIKGDCYLKIVSNFDYYMNLPLKFVTKSKYPDREITYPLAILDDVEIHFTHYKSEEEVLEKWERRKTRMFKETNKDNYFFKICNSWDAHKAHFKAFHQIPFKNKISFSIYDYSNLNLKNNFHIKETDKKDRNNMVNGVKLFKLSFLYVDIFKWIKNNSSK